MSEYLKHQVFLTKAQYETLLEDGSITVGGVTHTYDKRNNYFVQEDEVDAIINPAEKSDGQVLAYDLTNDTWKAYTIPTFTGAAAGLVPAATSSEANSFLRGDGTWYESSVTVPVASSSVLGGVMIADDSGLVIDASGNLELDDTNYATAETAGLIKVGDDLFIDEDGVLSSTDTTYEVFSTQAAGLVPKPTQAETAKYLMGDHLWHDLPIATTSSTGIISVGQDLSVTQTGQLSVDRTYVDNNKLRQTAIFSEYDTLTFYLVGQRVSYHGNLYICITDTVGGAFDPEYWESASFDDLYQTKVTCSTVDIGVGADLPSGSLYFVYEE